LVNSGGTLPAILLTVTDSDNATASTSATPGLTTTNDAPTISLTANTLEEGSATTDTVAGSFSAADEEGEVTVTLNNTDGYFVIDGTDVKLTEAGVALVNSGGTLPAILLTVTDSDNATASTSATPGLTTTNDAPTISLTANTLEEGSATTDTVAGSFSAADEEGEVTVTLNNTDGYFVIDGTDVKLTEAGVALVNSGGTLPAILLTVTDSDNATASTSATPGLTTTNDAPTISLTANTLEEGSATTDTVAGSFSAADEEGEVTVTLNNTDGYFVIDGTDVKLTEAGVALVNSGGTLPAILLTVTDSDNATASTSATPGLTTTNDAPTISLTANTLEEGSATTDTVAGSFSAADEEGEVTVTLNNTDGYFVIDGTDVKLTEAGVALVNSGGTLPAILLTVTDSDNATASTSATPGLTTTNDAPTISLTANTLEEGSATTDTVAGSFSAADEEGEVTVTLNNTDGYFVIDGTDVKLTEAGVALVNSGGTLPAILLTVTDSDNATASTSATPGLTTTNDAPTIANTLTNNFTEDSGAAVGDTVATFDAADADDTLTTDSFTLSDTTNYTFSYADGVVTVTLTQAGLDLVNAGTDLPTFTVTVSDGKVSTQASANPSINTIDDLPSTRSDSITVFENTTSTVNVLDGVLANDFDEEGALTVRGFSSVASTTYHPNTGQITPGTERVIGNQLWSSAGSTDAGQSITTQFGTMTINSDGSFNYAVNEEYCEQLSAKCIVYDEFTYEAMDSNGNITTESIIVEIRGVNDAVIVTHDTMETTENSKAIGNVLNNDLEIDIDGKIISMKVTGVSFGEIDKDNMPTDNVSVEVKGQYGTLLIEENGDYTYTPFPEIANQLLEGDQITEVFNYVVSDAYSSSQGEITITINGMGINTTPETSSTVNTLTETVETEPAESNSITESVEEAPAQESTAVNETTAEEIAEVETAEEEIAAEEIAEEEIAEEEIAEEELISEDEVESEDSESIDEESVTIDDDGNVIVDTGTIQVAEVAVEDDGSISVSVVDDNATEVQEYALADDGSIPDWVSIDSVTGEITVNPPPGETEVTFTIQAIDANGAIRTITMSLDLVNGTATTLNLSEALDSSSEGNIQLIANDSDTSIDNASNVTETFDVDSGDILSSNSAGTTSIELSNIQSTDQGYVIDIIDQNAANVASYSITSPNGGPIPSWVSFNAETGQIVANPPDGVDAIVFVVTANDLDGSSREITATIDFDSSTNPNLELNEEDGGFGMNNSSTTPFSDQLNQEIFEDEKQNIA
jgi:VCBS repeat-containing protein